MSVAAYIQECGLRKTALGPALYIKIRRYDNKRMNWEQVWKVFADAYPGQWAVEVYPPVDQLVNDVSMYHLFVISEEPEGLNIRR